MCARAQARATPEKGDSQRVAMTAHFQVQTFEVRALFQVVYNTCFKEILKKGHDTRYHQRITGQGSSRLANFIQIRPLMP